MRRYRRAQAVAARYEAAAAGERRVAASLLTLTGIGWTLLIDRRWPGSMVANVDMIAVGPGGVVVIDVKNWRDTPRLVDGRLHAGAVDRDMEVDKLMAITRRVQDALIALDAAPAVVAPMMVFAGHNLDSRIGTVGLLGAGEVVRRIADAPRRLTAAQVTRIAERLATVFPAYEAPSVDTDPAPSPVVETPALFDAAQIARAHEEAVLARPIEQWMTFLHPDQLALVRRRWNGPARISGAAGTGKTVVALHRAVWLAQRTTGKILYITFARNLPRVQATLLARLSPAVAHRVEFVSLHAWARALLHNRGINVRVDSGEGCFGLAWLRAGRGTVLERIDKDTGYWKDEIGYVIKGRGITSMEQYLQTTRHGRRAPLQRQHRQAVWHLFEAYEDVRRERGLHDFADLLLTALREVRSTPVEPAYTAVIADEVQDLTLTGVQLLHALVGERLNGLLLIGDGQQAVYPGGFRLAEAGIDIRGGRAEVLKVNYRNASAILDAAMEVLEGQSCDDIDGSVIVGPTPVETTHHHGTVTRHRAPTEQAHDVALVAAVAMLMKVGGTAALADAAVLCARLRDVDRYRQMLTRSGVPVCNLADYDGQPIDAIKIGTYQRAKGLEFKHVYIPHYDRATEEATRGDVTDSDRIALSRRQLHVGMTRARDTLWLGAIDPDPSDGPPSPPGGPLPLQRSDR